MTRRLLFAAAIVLFAMTAAAQELAIFDLNDFVDPRELGAIPVSKHRFGCPCPTVLVTRVMTGWDHEYIDVTRASRAEVAFGHVAASVYRGPWQWNAKVSVLHGLEHLRTGNAAVVRPFPGNSVVLQAAYYLRGPGSSSLRSQLSWRGTQYPEGTHDAIAHELGAEVDTQVKLFGHYVEGSLIFTTLVRSRRDQSESSRLGYVQRFPRIRLGALRIDPSLTAGLLGEGLNFGDAGRLNVQPKIHASLPLRLGGANLNVIYGPSYARLQPPARVIPPPICSPCNSPPVVIQPPAAWQSYHEVAVFVDVPVLLRSH